MITHLPDFVIAGLYKDSLVLANEKFAQPAQLQQQINNKTAKADEVTIPPNKKWFLGDNKKNIIILVKDDAVVFINDQWLDTLGKLLTACKLNLGDVALINHLQNAIAFNTLKEQLQPQYIFMFDVSTQDIQLPFTMPHYQVQQYAGCTLMTAPVVTLSTDKNTQAAKAEKRKLWEKLKTIFRI